MKRCSKCGIVKDLSEFYRHKTARDGYRSDCKECRHKHQKEYYKEHKKEIQKHQKEYREENKDAVRKRDRKIGRKYRKGHKKQKAAIQKKYLSTIPGKLAMKWAGHKRRMKKKATEATLTTDQWGAILNMQNNHCNVCGKRFTIKRPPTIDHIIPLSKGGGLTFENVQALCLSCNSTKHAKLDKGYIQIWNILCWSIISIM